MFVTGATRRSAFHLIERLAVIDPDPSPSAQVQIVVGLIVFALLVFAIAFVVVSRLNRRWKNVGPTMTMRFTVGSSEEHVVNVDFTQPTERLVVHVDGIETVNQSFAAGFKLTRSLEFEIGLDERHHVVIVKKRQRIYGGLKPQQFSAQVDGDVVAKAESRFPSSPPTN